MKRREKITSRIQQERRRRILCRSFLVSHFFFPLATGADVDKMSVEAVLGFFDEVQGGRVKTYKEFSFGFKEMLRSDDFKNYQALGARITQSFAKLSAQINQIEASLRSRSMVEQADLVREIQEQEKRKLQLVSSKQQPCHRYVVLPFVPLLADRCTPARFTQTSHLESSSR